MRSETLFLGLPLLVLNYPSFSARDGGGREEALPVLELMHVRQVLHACYRPRASLLHGRSGVWSSNTRRGGRGHPALQWPSWGLNPASVPCLELVCKKHEALGLGADTGGQLGGLKEPCGGYQGRIGGGKEGRAQGLSVGLQPREPLTQQVHSHTSQWTVLIFNERCWLGENCCLLSHSL